MTTKESICVKCAYLNACLTATCTSEKGVTSLISDCTYGGVNSGNRKKCKHFTPASISKIQSRLEVLERGPAV